MTFYGVNCSVVTSVNQTSTLSIGNSHSPYIRCEHGVNKSRLSFDFRWFYLNGVQIACKSRVQGGKLDLQGDFKRTKLDAKVDENQLQSASKVKEIFVE